MNDLIGFFVARFRGAVQLTRWHLIDSEISDRKVTRCGRQLHHQEGTSLTVIVGPPPSDTGCKRCQ